MFGRPDSKFKYYDIERLVKDYPAAYYYVVYGERSNGKTYSALSYALERRAKGEHFAYIRRWGEDIKPKTMNQLFAGHIANGVFSKLFPGYDEVVYRQGAYYLAKVNDKGKLDLDRDPLGFVFSLNAMEHNKSVSYPKITTVIFDEFLSRNGYLPNEFILFTNTLSTIIRDRNNVKVLMLGNTVNQYCPYFKEMGLVHVREQKQGTVDVYHYGDSSLEVVVEYAESAAKKGGKKSDDYFAFDNPELKMITGGAWEIAIYPHYDKKILPKEVVTDFFIEFNGEKVHGQIVSTDNLGFVYFFPKYDNIKDEENDIVYTDRVVPRYNYRRGFTRFKDPLTQWIMAALRENRAYYATNETGEIVRNFIMWSDSLSIKN